MPHFNSYPHLKFFPLAFLLVLAAATPSVQATDTDTSPTGAWLLDDDRGVLAIGEQDGRFIAVFPDGRIRALAGASPSQFTYGATLGDTKSVQGTIRLPETVANLAATNVNRRLHWQDARLPESSATRVPHREMAATFSNGDTRLSGTLFLPSENGPFPAVVLAHGSGQEKRRRDALVFAFIAHGIGVLSFDKRGVGQSSGGWRAPFQAYAEDVVAAVSWLRNHRDIDPKKIGIWGHSQGAWIAPLAATLSPHVAFVVAEAGGGVNPVVQDLFHGENILGAKTKYSKAQIAEVSAFRQLKYDLVSGKIERRIYDAALESARQAEWFRSVGDGLPNAEFWAPNAGYDPAATLAKVSCPALFILGEYDAYGPSGLMKGNIEKAFAINARSHQSVVMLKNANHALFMAEKIALLENSPVGTERLADGYQALLFSWLRERVK